MLSGSRETCINQAVGQDRGGAVRVDEFDLGRVGGARGPVGEPEALAPWRRNSGTVGAGDADKDPAVMS